jgi:hypothetical protein
MVSILEGVIQIAPVAVPVIIAGAPMIFTVIPVQRSPVAESTQHRRKI